MRDKINTEELVDLLKQYCTGDWWDNIPPLTVKEDWGDCEACITHPCTQEQADLVNKLFDKIKEAGGPSPYCAYPWCGGEIFIEWWNKETGKDSNSIVLNINTKFNDDVMVRLKDQPIYFKDFVND